MKKQQLLFEAGALSERDRLELAIELRDSVDAESADLPLTEVQRSELDRRLDAFLRIGEMRFPPKQFLTSWRESFEHADSHDSNVTRRSAVGSEVVRRVPSRTWPRFSG